MLFNSIDFAIFFPIVYIVYWFLLGQSIQNQNKLLLVASYIFYGWWDWRFLILIIGSSLIDYYAALFLFRTNKKIFLHLSLLINLGLLGFFKYFNFFVESFAAAYTFFGGEISTYSIKIILPVGISFYTFQTLSYTLDVYRKKIAPTENIVNFLAYVSFFPQLVAGPIERASHLLPQFNVARKYSSKSITEGLRQILWGLFKKVIIADGCAVFVNQIFNNYEEMNSIALVMGAFFFAIQIYGDFSGYSDMAIGLSRLLGFNLSINFSTPYFASTIKDFWRRWHISLTNWFRDYLYYPLGGSRDNKYKTLRNTLIIFIVSGFWHGANWTFIAWGGLHAIFFIPSIFYTQQEVSKSRNVINFIFTQSIILLGWILFRSDTIFDAYNYIQRIFTQINEIIPNYRGRFESMHLLFWIILMFTTEWKFKNELFTLSNFENSYPRLIRYFLYNLLLLSILWYSNSSNEFVYFQF